MKPSVSITGEQEANKVAAIFETETDANGVARCCRRKPVWITSKSLL